MAQTDSARQTDPMPTAAVNGAPATVPGENPAAASAALVYAMFLGGLVLIGTGLWLVITGFLTGKPTARKETPAAAEKQAEPAVSRPRYRMTYDESRRSWGLAGVAAGSSLWLPADAFPRPGLFTPPPPAQFAVVNSGNQRGPQGRNPFSPNPAPLE